MNLARWGRALPVAALLACSCARETPQRIGGPETLFAGDSTVAARGPLRVLAANPRYFTDGSGRAVYLTGSHTWDNRQDIGSHRFDWDGYLARLQGYHHNFVRFWMWEQPKGLTTWPDPVESLATVTPVLFVRSGPGLAADGEPRFDLTRVNPEHLARLRERVAAMGQRGIYASIMLFDGWSIEQKAGGANPWLTHPFHRDNNVNGVDGDPNGDRSGAEIHTLAMPAVTALQEAYLRSLIDAVNDLDNVLYEISNESPNAATDWQYHMIEYVKSYERTKPKQHPVGMTSAYPKGWTQALFDSPADWVAPNADSGYTRNPPPGDGSKVIMADTDHLWGIGGNRGWAWKSFTRGLNVMYMDPWEGRVIAAKTNEDLRVNMGYVRAYARRIDLAAMPPHAELASSRYCLARPDSAFLVYLPRAGDGVKFVPLMRVLRKLSPWIKGNVDVDLSAAHGSLAVEWFDPATGTRYSGAAQAGGKRTRFAAPFGGDAVLYLHR